MIIKSKREPRRNLAYAYYNRGLAYTRKGDDDRAIADFSTAIKLNSRDAAAYHTRGFSYSRKGDYDRARNRPHHKPYVDCKRLSMRRW